MAQIKGEATATLAKTVNNSAASNFSASKFLNPTVSSTQFYLYRYNDLGTRLTSLPTYKFYYIDQGNKTQITDLSLVYDGNGLFHISGNLNSYTFYYKPSTGESKSSDEWQNVIIALMDSNNDLFALSKQMPITFTSGSDTMSTISMPSNTITVSNTPSAVTMTKTTEITLPYDISTNTYKFDNSFYASFVKAQTGTNYQGSIYGGAGYATTLISANYTFLADDSAYEKVDYIQASGTQYINTGYKISSEKMKVEFGCLLPDSINGLSLFGSNGSVYDLVPYTATAYGTRVFRHWVGSSGGIFDVTYGSGKNTVVYDLNNGSISCTMNAIPTSSTYSGSIQSNQNFYIFGKNGNGSSAERANGYTLYYLKLYDNDILVRDLIPAKRKTDNVYGLYDQLSGVFYENAGTGAFTGA